MKAFFLFLVATIFAPVFASQWQDEASLPIAVQEIYPIVHRQQIWVVGGLSPQHKSQSFVSDEAWIYSPESQQWKKGPSLPEPRHHPLLISTGEQLFSFGGFVLATNEKGEVTGRWRASDDVLLLDENKQQWVHVGNLPQPLGETVGAYINGHIHIATGRSPVAKSNAKWNDHRDIDKHWIFNPQSFSFMEKAPLEQKRNSAASVVLDGSWYVVGGRTVNGGNVALFERYDAVEDEWISFPPLPQAQGGLAASVINNRIYVFGGEFFNNGGGVYGKVWSYDPEQNRWQLVTTMPTPRHGLGAVTLMNKIYVVAGATGIGPNGTSNHMSSFQPINVKTTTVH